MKMNYNKKNIKMQKKYIHLMPLLLVPSIAIALIIVVGIVFCTNCSSNIRVQLRSHRRHNFHSSSSRSSRIKIPT